MKLQKTYRKLTTALGRFWHREAGPMNWKNPVRVTAYIGWHVFNGAAFLGPLRRPGRADFPGNSPHRDPLCRGGLVRCLELCPASFSGA